MTTTDTNTLLDAYEMLIKSLEMIDMIASRATVYGPYADCMRERESIVRLIHECEDALVDFRS